MSDAQKCTELLTLVAQAMKDLRDQVVFIGGITTFAYLDSPVALEVRPTEDVDCTVEVTNLLAYKQLETKLMSLGFKHDTSRGAPTCRWTIYGVKVDVMPTEEKILGFSNRWYPRGIANKIAYTLKSTEVIYLFSLPYFIASKLEAYHSRGHGDPRTSTDIEDILLILDGAKTVEHAILKASPEIQMFLGQSFSGLFKTNLFNETIEGMFSREGIERVQRVRSLAQKFASKV